MYLHFSLDKINLKFLPTELGKVSSELNKEDDLSEIYYYLNNSPIIDLETAKGSLDSVRKVNLLIGSNNSGKSRFLRGLLKTTSVTISDDQFTVKDSFERISKDIRMRTSRSDGIEKPIKTLWKSIDKEKDTIKILRHKIVQLEDIIVNYNKQLTSHISSNSVSKIIRDYIRLSEEVLAYLNKLIYSLTNSIKRKVYIPTMRTLVSDDNLHSDSFENVVKYKYGIENNVFTGQNLFDSIYNLHNSSKIYQLEAFCNWISSNFYREHKVQLIPDRDSKNVLLKIDGTTLYPIYNIGDGVQQLILLLFPIYTSENNTAFFIEEPETHLHPGLQRIFIETLLNDEHLKKKNLRFFFTTHSNHFLDISLDHEEISIFQFEKESPEKFNIKTNVKPNKEILDLLGVNTSSVFLANTSIWVEGPTDRKYISKWLKLYCEHKELPYLKEDIDFAFFEYGGNLIEHYLFDKNFDEDVSESQVRKKIKAFALSNKVYLLADNDNIEEGSAKYKRRENLQSVSDKNFKYQNTEYREIENLLPVKVIKDFIPELVKEHEGHERIGFKRADYYTKGLGDYLESVLKPNFDCKKFKAPSGTLNNLYKNKLCDFFVNGNYRYSDLIEDNAQLEEIVESLYEFLTSK